MSIFSSVFFGFIFISAISFFVFNCKKILRNINGSVFSLLSGGAAKNNYWHWIFDTLPKIAILEKLNINIIILNSNEFKNIYNIYNTMEQYDPEKFTILLIYENESHFKLLGHFQETNILVYFDPSLQEFYELTTIKHPFYQ